MSPRLQRLAPFALILAVWLCLCAGVLRDWRLNSDEGFYLAASRAAGQGLLPYRDYAYTQMPLLPLIQAPFFRMLPASLQGVRMLSLLWTTFSLGVAYAILRTSLGPLRACACLAVFLLCTETLGNLSIGKTYALAHLFLLAAAFALYSGRPWRERLVLLSLSGVLSVGVRLTLAPSVLVLWAGFWILNRREAKVVWMIGVPAALALALIGPFAAADPQRFLFFNWGFHTFSFVPRHPSGFWPSALAYLPGPAVVGALATAALRRPTPAAVLLVAAAVGIGANLAFAGAYLEYLTPFILPLLVGAAGVLAQGPPRLELVAYGCGIVLGSMLLRVPDRSGCVADARGASDFLRSHTAPGTPVLASMPEIPVEAGRPVFRNLLMGKFTVTGDLPESLAKRYGFIPIGDLIHCLELRLPGAVVLSASPAGNFSTSYPSELRFAAIRGRMMAAMAAGYSLAYSNATYAVLLPSEAGRPPVPLAGL